MGSHSVTYHPTEVRIPRLPPAEAGTRFSDPGGGSSRDARLSWPMLRESHRPGIEPATCKSQVQRPTAEPPRNGAFLRQRVYVTLTVLQQDSVLEPFHYHVRVSDRHQSTLEMCRVVFHQSRQRLHRRLELGRSRSLLLEHVLRRQFARLAVRRTGRCRRRSFRQLPGRQR